MKHLGIYLLYLLISANLMSQDVLFSNFEEAFLYYNPSFSSQNKKYGVGIIARNQWASSTGAYLFTHFHGDYRINDEHGTALHFTHEKGNSGNFNQWNLVASYAYTLSISSKWNISSGIGLGIQGISLDSESYIFEDAINSAQNTAENLGPINNQSALSLNIGFKFFYLKKTLLAIGIKNINNPSFKGIETETPTKSIASLFLSHKTQISGNYYRPRSIKTFLIPSIIFIYKAPFSQLRLGTDFEIESVIMGLHYRGLIGEIDTYQQSDALIFRTGVNVDHLKFIYSYDFSVSERSFAGGTHELGIKYILSTEANKGSIRQKR